MSSFEEVQQLEIEAIESLYSFENEFLRLSHNSFQLNLKSSPTFQNSSISLKNKKVTLHISYPKEYPQVLPDWSLNKLEGVSDEEGKQLHLIVEKTMSECLNSPMIFTVAQVIQDFLSNNPQDTPDHTQCRTAEESLQPAEQSSKCDDKLQNQSNEDSCTPSDSLLSKTMCDATCRITEDQFLSWKKEFREKMIQSGIWLHKTKGNKLTGREIFERNTMTLQNTSKTSLLEEESINSKSSPLWNNASLFSNVDTNFSNNLDLFCNDQEISESPVLQ